MSKVIIRQEEEPNTKQLRKYMVFMESVRNEPKDIDNKILLDNYLALTGFKLKASPEYGILDTSYKKSNVLYKQSIRIGFKMYGIYYSVDYQGEVFIKEKIAHYFPLIIGTSYLDEIFQRSR